MGTLPRLSRTLRRARRQRGLSQQSLAERAGLTREYLARLETGQHNPSVATIQKLARALRVPVTELLS